MASFSPAVICYEEEGARRETFGLEDVSIVTTLRVASNQRYILANDLLANRREWPYNISGGGTARPKVSSVAISTGACSGADGQAMVYTDALCEVTYSSLDNVDLIAESLEPRAEFMTMDYKDFRWGSISGVPLKKEEAPGRLVKSLDWVRTHYHIQNIPTTFLSLIGSVNNAAVYSTSLGLTFAIGTLLFNPPKPRRTITTAGAQAWTVDTRFSYKPETWNKFWRPETGGYASIYHVGAGAEYENYPEADFSSLTGLT